MIPVLGIGAEVDSDTGGWEVQEARVQIVNRPSCLMLRGRVDCLIMMFLVSSLSKNREDMQTVESMQLDTTGTIQTSSK